MRKKSIAYRIVGATAYFLESEYAAGSYDSAFSEDMGLNIPAAPLTGFLTACFISALYRMDKAKAENIRDVQKGLRDIQRVDQGLADFCGHGHFFNPYTLLFGSIYAVILMAVRWDKIQQEQQIERNRRTAAQLRTMAHGAFNQNLHFRIQFENNLIINRWRASVQAVSGALAGVYMGFSAFQVTHFICYLAPSIAINPIPFVITGFVLAAIFCVKRLYDQHRLNIKKNISGLECDLQLKKLQCRQLQHDIASTVDSKSAASLCRQLQSTQQDIEENRRQLAAERKKLQSVTQWGNNFINVSQKTISTIKNNTLGLINLANFISFTGVTGLKIAGGASLLSILGGPIAVALTVVIVASLLFYVSYNTYKRHLTQQRQWLKQTPETELQSFAVEESATKPEIKAQHMQFFKDSTGLTCRLKKDDKPLVHKKVALSKL